MSYPYKYILDEVKIEYDADQRKYHISFCKVVKNLGADPLESIYARLVVNAFPEDEHLSILNYRVQPLDLSQLGFTVCDEHGSFLSYEIRHQHDSNIELDLHFEDVVTKEKQPLYKGERRKIVYKFNISDGQWGPFIQRRIRVVTDRIKVRLIFPQELTRVWGEYTKASGGNDSFFPPIKKKKLGHKEEFIWQTTTPEVGARYRINWFFQDQRHKLLRETTRQQLYEMQNPTTQSPAATKHSEDFRTIVWYGSQYTFTATQAACIAVLWTAWENGTPEVGQEYILEEAGSQSKRLLDLFRNHPAWKTLIQPGEKKGSFRLMAQPKNP